jgi:hypothetical protein
VRGCEARSRAAHGSPADRTREGEKGASCVTTRRRNFWLLTSLGRGLGPLTARALCLGVPGFGLGGLAMSGLPPRRLPAVDFPLAFRLPAVALVPTSRVVLATASFAQADPGARPARSGPTAVLSLNVVGAHGRCCSQGNSSGRMCHRSPRALSKREGDACLPVYRLPRNKTENETDLKMRIEGDIRINDSRRVSLQMLEPAAEFLLGPRSWL